MMYATSISMIPKNDAGRVNTPTVSANPIKNSPAPANHTNEPNAAAPPGIPHNPNIFCSPNIKNNRPIPTLKTTYNSSLYLPNMFSTSSFADNNSYSLYGLM